MIPVAAWRQSLAHDVWVAPNATLVGSVSIGATSSVWYSVVLRGDGEPISIGRRSNIQDGVVIHTDPGFSVRIGDGVSVGHNAVLHGCTVEDDVLVGMAAVLMNGVVVGAGSIVGAGALLPEGFVVPPGSLVLGAPARVRRETTAQEREAVHRNASSYAQLALIHRDAGAASTD